MKLAQFFITRPIFAAVLSLLIVVAGGIALVKLPVSEYPSAAPDFIMVVHLLSPDARYDMLYLSNFAHLRVKDELARINGVGAVQVFGAGEYSMRVWLDPDRLAARQLTASDVVRAIREQNLQAAAGVLGAPPSPTDTTFQLSINVQGRLTSEDEFANIVVRATPDGQIPRIRDLGRVQIV